MSAYCAKPFFKLLKAARKQDAVAFGPYLEDNWEHKLKKRCAEMGTITGSLETIAEFTKHWEARNDENRV